MNVVSWKDIKLGIGICNNQEYLLSEFFWSFADLLKPTNFVVIRGQSRLKAASLNHIVREAYSLNCQKLLFIDTDQTFPFDTIPKLLSRNEPIVSGLTYMRGHLFNPLAGWKKDGNYVNSNGENWKENFADFPDNDDHLVEVDWTSVGCLLVDMDVFNKIYFPCFKEEWDDEEGARSKGHDLIFCDSVREAGYKIYVDTLVQCTHIFRMNINDIFVKSYYASKFPETYENTIKAAAREKLYWDERHFADRAGGVKRIYREEWDFIADTIAEKSSVAEVGCGFGFLMEELRDKRNCDCYGYDLSSVAIDTLKARGMNGEQADFRTFEPNGRKFDYAISSHVLEHMKDEDDFLKRMASLLHSNDGTVIVSVPTDNLGIISVIEHERTYTPETLETLMRRNFDTVNIASFDREFPNGKKSQMLVGVGTGYKNGI